MKHTGAIQIPWHRVWKILKTIRMLVFTSTRSEIIKIMLVIRRLEQILFTTIRGGTTTMRLAGYS